MPYCGYCGKQIEANTKFCGFCGSDLTMPPKQVVNQQKTMPPASVMSPPQNTAPPQVSSLPLPPPPPPPPPPEAAAPILVQSAPQVVAPVNVQPAGQAGSERIIGALLLRQPKSLGRFDSYAGVITTNRMIIALITNQMITQSVQAARDQAKAEGKGFWGQWADQLKTSFGYTQRFLSMQPAAILAETPGNYAIDNNAISEIKIHLKELHRGNDSAIHQHEFEIHVHSAVGNVKYKMDENSNYIDLLKSVYGDRVKMPFGNFSKAININI
jgi:hypothetical protein